MSYQERDTGAWLYTGPELGQCLNCGVETLLDEDGLCTLCASESAQGVLGVPQCAYGPESAPDSAPNSVTGLSGVSS